MLVVIFINHIPGSLLAHYTPSNFSFSDAAEIFVLLAGVSATLTYGRLIEQRGFGVGLLRIGARLWTLYVAHLMVFLIVCGVVFMAVRYTQNPLYIEVINIQPFLSDPVNALVDVLMLVYQPSYLNILPLYLVLLLLFPVLYLAMRHGPLMTLVASVSLWQLSGYWGLNLPDHSGGGGWFFNPFAWQLVFTLGIFIGQAKMRGLTLAYNPYLTVLALLVALGLCVARISPNAAFDMPLFNSWVEELHLSNNKMNLAPVRVIHLLSLVWLFCTLVSHRATWLTAWPARQLAVMGSHALVVFCAGSILSIISLVVMVETAYALNVQLLVCTIGITLLSALGAFLSWYRRQFAPQAKGSAHGAVGSVWGSSS